MFSDVVVIMVVGVSVTVLMGLLMLFFTFTVMLAKVLLTRDRGHYMAKKGKATTLPLFPLC